MPKSHKSNMVKILIIFLLLSLTACSAQGGRKANQDSRDNSTTTVDTPKINIAMITHAAQGDTFWDTVRKGAQQAAKKNNTNLQYANSPEARTQAQLIQQYVDQKVDGIIVTLAKPEALKDALDNASSANIPIVTINSGSEYSTTMNAIAHFGQNENIAGKALGEELNLRNLKSAICVIHEQGQIGLESRCDGIKESFTGKIENLYVNGANMPQTAATITAKLQSSDSDTIIGLSSPITATIMQSVADSRTSIDVASFDISLPMAEAILEEKIIFTLDQQPYLQGYLAVDAIWLNALGSFQVGGGQPVHTGPQIINKSNIANIIEAIENGLR